MTAAQIVLERLADDPELTREDIACQLGTSDWSMTSTEGDSKCSSTLALLRALAKKLTVVIPPPLVDNDLRSTVPFTQVSDCPCQRQESYNNSTWG